MMTGLDRIYGESFFADWGAENSSYVETARYVADVIHGNFSPRRLIDLGCGCGVYSERFRSLGVEVTAVDGVRPPARYSFPVPVLVRDLTEPIRDDWGRFDLTLCLEVAEHIPEPLSGPFLENLTRFGDTLVLSCAPPYQGGTHHVNERPKRYWIERLDRLGFAYNRRRTGRLSERFKADSPPLMWMCQQISVYERRRVG